MRHVLLRDLYFICIFIDTTRSELLNFIFQSDIMKIWAHIKLSPFYYKANGLNQLALTLPVTTVYLLHLPNPTTSHRVSSVRLPKCITTERCFIFFTRDWGKNNKKHFHSVEIGNDILIYIKIKQVFFDSLIKSTVYLLIFCQNSMIFEGSPNSLTKSYFTGELWGSPNFPVN